MATFRFRKSLNLGICKLNFGKTGLTSISTGIRGFGVSYGRKGVRSHIGLPGTGLSLQHYEKYRNELVQPKLYPASPMPSTNRFEGPFYKMAATYQYTRSVWKAILAFFKALR
jgi:hypothetical protein